MSLYIHELVSLQPQSISKWSFPPISKSHRRLGLKLLLIILVQEFLTHYSRAFQNTNT